MQKYVKPDTSSGEIVQETSVLKPWEMPTLTPLLLSPEIIKSRVDSATENDSGFAS